MSITSFIESTQPQNAVYAEFSLASKERGTKIINIPQPKGSPMSDKIKQNPKIRQIFYNGALQAVEQQIKNLQQYRDNVQRQIERTKQEIIAEREEEYLCKPRQTKLRKN